MTRALRLHAIAKKARGGDEHSALELARRAPRDLCPTFVRFITEYVPEGELTVEIFDRFDVAWTTAEQERVRAQMPTVEIPTPSKETL